MNRVVCWLMVCCIVGSDAFHIEQKFPNGHMYLDQQNDKNAFNYGYQVDQINDQFQYKQKGADEVTYGCYGYIDPNGHKQLTFFVADRLGYRVVSPGRYITVYPVTYSASAKVTGVTGRRQLQWKEIPFHADCRPNDERIIGTSASAEGNVDEHHETNFEPAAQPKPAKKNLTTVPAQVNPDVHHHTKNQIVGFERHYLQGNSTSSSSVDSVAHGTNNGFGPETNHVPMIARRPSKKPQPAPKPELQGALWTQNGHKVIQKQTSKIDTDQPPLILTTSNGEAAEEKGSQPDSWRPFVGTNNSFLLSSQCERADCPSEGKTLTLYIPFRIACSDMKEFETALASLTAQFARAEC